MPIRPPSAAFMDEHRAMQDAYLATDDPIEQSGFHGGGERWRAERSIVLRAFDRDVDFLDACCANGYLLECLELWSAERGRVLRPYGLDLGPRLVEIARRRLPAHAAHLHVGDLFHWQPPRRYDVVYVLADVIERDRLGELVAHLEPWIEPGGQLVVGDYASRSRGTRPRDLGRELRELGFAVAGEATAGDPVATSIAWVDQPCVRRSSGG